MEIPFYVGCYAPKGQDSLFAYCLNTQTGSVTQTHTCAEVENPSYLALSSDGETLYAVSETETFQGQAGGGFAALSCKNSFSVYGQSATRGTFPCHILLQEADSLAFISNYGSGSISTFHIKPAAAPRLESVTQHHGHGPNAERQEGPHVHSCTWVGEQLGAADLGIDRIALYHVHKGKLTAAGAIALPAGSGVRHFVCDVNRADTLYAACELTSEVAIVKKAGDCWQAEKQLSALPHAVTGNTCAAIRQTRDGRFLLVSNRGHNSIAVFRCTQEGLSPLHWIDTHGQDPRDFLLVQNFLLVANQTSRSLSIFKFNPQTAEAALCQTVSFPAAPVCITAPVQSLT